MLEGLIDANLRGGENHMATVIDGPSAPRNQESKLWI
jgi:hypothetical protein